MVGARKSQGTDCNCEGRDREEEEEGGGGLSNVLLLPSVSASRFRRSLIHCSVMHNSAGFAKAIASCIL